MHLETAEVLYRSKNSIRKLQEDKAKHKYEKEMERLNVNIGEKDDLDN